MALLLFSFMKRFSSAINSMVVSIIPAAWFLASSRILNALSVASISKVTSIHVLLQSSIQSGIISAGTSASLATIHAQLFDKIDLIKGL